jgi:hypothetical protein
MSLNPTVVMRRLGVELGLSHMDAELADFDMMNVVYEVTLPTFSDFFPYKIMVQVSHDKDLVDGYMGRYYLRTNFEILGISKLFIDDYQIKSLQNQTYYDYNPFTVAMKQNMEPFVTGMVTPKFHHPNQIELFPKHYAYGNFSVELKVMHPRHLATIPLNLREEFLELAVIDVKSALYPIRKRFQSMSTPFGSIELNIEDLQSAVDRRRDLLEKWTAKLLKTGNLKKIYFA